MDKMTVNMIAGAVLSALLALFATSTFVDILYPRGGEAEAPVEQAAVAGTPGAGTPAAGGATQPLAVLLASANAEAGAGQAKKCVACHSFDQGGANKIGPNLAGVVGRAVASNAGFAYSEALKAYAGNWDYERLSCYLLDPKACVPGNKMSFAGIKADKDRADVIGYLRSISPSAPPLPAAEASASANQNPAPPPAAPAQN